MLYTFYLSLTDWDMFTAPRFVGLSNFRRLSNDPVFHRSLLNNLKWMAVFITIPIAAGLALAMVLNRKVRGSTFFKVSFFLPMVLSLVVAGLVWSWLYNPAYGLINVLLRTVGLPYLARGWLASANTAMESIIAVGVWRQVGYVMVFYLAGLQSVNQDLVDASRVDGASSWKSFRHVVLPQLAPITTVVIVISIIDSLRVFALVSVMTGGGPHNSSNVLANYVYLTGFQWYQMGYAAAIAVVLFLLASVFIVFYLSRIAKEEDHA
ncbi:MAG: sugar ABC transporter permease [Spirochaetaceae bacterium]|nr:MAG: sugar ABC transporter permease [Spirochaetaceae bacterium]